MDLEDQRRFEVEALGVPCDDATTMLSCDRCGWTTEIDDSINLAELNLRADEHAEVCR